jgi:hypothetical protein
MDAMSGRCLACQADLRPDARFCPRCGQRAVAATPAPPQPPTITGLASPAMQEPRPAPATRGDWDDWYTITSPGQAPPPPSYQPQPYQIPPPARQQQPYPPRELPPGSVPLQRQPNQRHPNQRQPFQPPPGGPPGYEPWRPYQPGPPPAGPPRGSRRSNSNAGLWTILLLLLAGAGAGVVLLLAHPFGNHNQRQTASTGTASASHKAHASGSAKATPGSTASGSGTSSTVATSAAEQRAASSVASMLSQSASDRTAIIGAATDIGNCGPNLNADPKVFDDAAASRQTMLASLTAMPGRNTLPPALVSDLTQAWQASIAADQAYAKWANDEITEGCVRHDTSDPGYQATVGPNRQASQYKDSFVVLWNPIASGYGLTQYSADQF